MVSEQRIPRVPCSLCGEQIIWVESRSTKKKMPLNPDPVPFPQGNLARVHHSLVDGRRDVVDVVPESERWMKSHLYLAHHATCHVWLSCVRDGIRNFKECQERCNHQKGAPILSQSRREELNPVSYKVNREG